MIAGSAALALAMGFAFGWLLQRARLTDCNVVEGQFHLTDFTMIKVMLPAIIIGGLGVVALIDLGGAKYYIKDASLLAVALGAALFGFAWYLGLLPRHGPGVRGDGQRARTRRRDRHGVRAILYALTTRILPVAAYGKVRIPDITGIPDIVWFLALAVASVALFYWVERPNPNGFHGTRNRAVKEPGEGGTHEAARCRRHGGCCGSRSRALGPDAAVCADVDASVSSA